MTTQIAVKLPDGLVQAVDRMVDAGAFESRSDAVRRALQGVLAEHRNRVIGDAFRHGFTSHPDTTGDLDDVRRRSIELIEQEPWEPWW
jgi:Arc/MetJ-type ribon-helix-helix transcriptional regulator